jgi:hypothetical protein
MPQQVKYDAMELEQPQTLEMSNEAAGACSLQQGMTDGFAVVQWSSKRACDAQQQADVCNLMGVVVVVVGGTCCPPF